MGTRCNIIVHKEGYEDVILYRHWDGGITSGMGKDLKGYMYRGISKDDTPQTIADHIANCDSSIENNEYSLAGDREYQYNIDMDNMRCDMFHVKHRNEPGWPVDSLEEGGSFDINEYDANRNVIRDLHDALMKGEVLFEYEKSDGSIRTARGTLNKSFAKEFGEYQAKGNITRPDYIMSYWDLDKGGFRSFNTSKFVRIISTKN